MAAPHETEAGQAVWKAVRHGAVRALVGLVLVLAGAWGLLSLDWCPPPPGRPTPHLVGAARAEGPLRAGAAEVPLALPSAVVRAGYPLPLQEAEAVRAPLRARALALQVEGLTVALATLDTLTLPEALLEAVRARLPPGLHLLLAATHTHSGPGGYDARLFSALAGTGRYRPEVEAALVEAAAQAVQQALASLAPATLQVGEAPAAALVEARWGRGARGEADVRVTRLQVHAAGRTHTLLVHAAHPTLVPAREAVLDPDWPGRLAASADGGLTLVLQGAVGNARVGPAAGRGGESPERHAAALQAFAHTVPLTQVEGPVALAVARATVALPAVDASRLVPGALARAGNTLLCTAAPAQAEVMALRLGPLRLLAVPGEPTQAAAVRLEAASGAQRTLSLANGYVGYVEPAARVEAGEGEAPRQYFSAALLAHLEAAARVAGAAVGE